MTKLIKGKTQNERVQYMLNDMFKTLKNPTRVAIYDLNRKHSVNNSVTKFLIQERYLSKANIYGKSNEYQWQAGRPTVQMAETVISGATTMNREYNRGRDNKAKRIQLDKTKDIVEIKHSTTVSVASLKRDCELKIFDLRARIAQDQAAVELYMSFVDKLDLLQ